MENLIGTVIELQGKEVTMTKITKDGSRFQFKPEAGKLEWRDFSDYNSEGSIFTKKAKQIFSDAAVTKDLARSKGFQTMKDYIIHLIFDNQDMKPTELAKAFNLPNPIYVSKLMKNGDFSTIKGANPKISAAWKAELAGETPEAKKPVAEKPSKSQAENKKIADRVQDSLDAVDGSKLPEELKAVILG